MQSIEFATPEWLAVGAACVAVLAVLFAVAERRRRAALRTFAAATPISSLSPARRWTRNVLALAATAFAFIALARPRSGYSWQETPRKGIDLMFAVDTSKSMRATDVAPDRLTRAKLAVTDLVRKMPDARVGLIAFAGGAFVQAPMTVDHPVFLEALQSLDTDIIPRPGTDLSSAIHAASEAMASEPDNRKVLVLLSDGEQLDGDAIAAARTAAKDGLRIYTVGVGSRAGSLIQVTGEDDSPQVVRSKLDETTLSAVAKATGGDYVPLAGLDRLYATDLTKLAATTAPARHRIYNERFEIPLALALFCMLAELLIRERKRGSRSKVAVAAFGAVGLLSTAASADPATYNAGVSTYRTKDFSTAAQQFQNALHTDNVAVQEDAYYNLGNTRYRIGEQSLTSDRDATLESWKHAVEAYDAALALDANDADAKFNRDLVARKLAALEKQKEQDKKQDTSQSQNQQNQKNQNQQGQQNQNQQGQQNQNQQGQQKQNQQGQSGQQQNQQGQSGQQQNQQQKGQSGQQQNQQQQGQSGQQQNQQQQGQNGQNQQQQGQSGQNQQQQGQNGQKQQQQGQSGQQQNQQQQGQSGQQQNQQGQSGQQQKQQGQNGQQQNQQGQNGQQQNQQQQGQNGQQQNQQGQSGQQPNQQAQNGAQQDHKAASPRDPGETAKPGNTAKPGQATQATKPEAGEHGTAAQQAGAQQGSNAQQAADAAQRAADQARRAAGQLTRAEAIRLLDASEDDLQPLPIDGTSRQQPSTNTHVKDW